jgi:hypothetical protein
MRVVFTIAQWLVRITGVLLLILGLLIWTEGAASLIGIHMLIGLVLVIGLLVLAGVAVPLGGPVGFAATVAVLSIVMLVFGMTQASILPGPNHWIVQVVHLLLGMAVVGMAEGLGGRVRRAQTAGSAA